MSAAARWTASHGLIANAEAAELVNECSKPQNVARQPRPFEPPELEVEVLPRHPGDVVTGMARHGWDLQLTEYDAAEHWRATFFVAGQAHSIVGGSAWEETPWPAVQQLAAWKTLAA